MQECKANIYVVGHKLFGMPTEDELYVPLMVGNKYGDCQSTKVSYYKGISYLCRDCDGDSISELNPSFNELTGTYWVWKNAEAQILGICHYRRYFTSPLGKAKNLLLRTLPSPITYRYIEKQLRKHDVIVHNKTYFKSTNREQRENIFS